MFVLFKNIPSEIEVPPSYKLLPLLPPNALLTLPIYDMTLLLYGLSGPKQNVGLEWVSGWSGYIPLSLDCYDY